jgi:hypothetical protein
MGMINIGAQLFLEEGDEGYDKYVAEHYVTTKDISEEGYPGEVDEMGMPLDEDDYNNWFDSLPNVQRLNPFCIHFIQFEPNVTYEEILWCFEWALGVTHQNYLKDDLRCKKGRNDEEGRSLSEIDYKLGGQIVNQSINYKARKSYYKALSFLPNGSKTTKEKEDFTKVNAAKLQVKNLKNVDLSKVSTIAKYKVKQNDKRRYYKIRVRKSYSR